MSILLPEIQFLSLLMVAVVVAIVVKRLRVPYTIALVLIGVVIGLTHLTGIELSKEMIFFIFLPPLLFEGAIHLDFDRLKRNFSVLFVLAFIGIIISTFIVGVLISELTGIPLIYAVLFGAMIMPTDPVSVLAIFKELGVTKKLSSIVDGESLFNDGTAVVLFEVILAVIATQHFSIIHTVFEFGKVCIGGLAIGSLLGYAAYKILQNLDDHLVEVLITGILAYGTFIVAESVHVSGVIGVVAAGILIGNRGTQFAMSPTTRISILNFWGIMVFIINSIIFLLIGMRISVTHFQGNITLILTSIAVVVFARALTVYPLVSLLNTRIRDKIPLNWQHVINWGGLHGSIPIALVLGLPAIAYKNEISMMVFAVVLFSLVFQGLTIKPLIRRLGITAVSEEEHDYETSIAKKVSVQKARKALRKMYDAKEIPYKIYKELDDEYEASIRELRERIAGIMDKHEIIRGERTKAVRRRVLMTQKSSIQDSLMKGLISEDVATELTVELDEELDALCE